MIKVSQTEERIRECKAPFIYQENGEIKEVEIRVRYFSPTVKRFKARQAEFKARAEANPDEVIWLSETLSHRVASLPDLLDDNDLPVAITVEFLDGLDTQNLEAIRNAIDEDLRPKKTQES